MKVEELQTYQEVVQSLRKKGRAKHLLLGNGFSMLMMPKYSHIMRLVHL